MSLIAEEHPFMAVHAEVCLYTAPAQNRNLHTSLVLSNAAYMCTFSRLINKCKHVIETNTTVLHTICAMNEWRKDWEINYSNPAKDRLKTEPLYTCRLFLIYHLKNVYLHHTAARWKAASVWMLCCAK